MYFKGFFSAGWFRLLTLFGVVVTGLLANQTQAHALAPILLTTELLQEDRLQAVWTFPPKSNRVNPELFRLRVESCSLENTPALTATERGIIRLELYQCAGEGKPHYLHIDGLANSELSVALRTVGWIEEESIYILDGETDEIVLEMGRSYSWTGYLALGVQHILGGLDHLLFVIALFFWAGGELRRVAWLVTAFTLAHSITLSAAAIGLVRVSGPPVETLIALSILLVAAELISAKQQQTKKQREYWPIVFFFGLLHGLGFAGALAEIGLPENTMLSALLSFNIGVELGQLGVLCACSALTVIASLAIDKNWLQKPVGYLIGSIAGFWFIERLVLVLG